MYGTCHGTDEWTPSTANTPHLFLAMPKVKFYQGIFKVNFKTPILAIIFFVISGCSSVQPYRGPGYSPADYADLNEFPSFIREAFARETTITTSSKLTINHLGIDAPVKGKLKLTESGENYLYYTIDIGTTAEVECYVFNSYDGPSNTLHTLVESYFSNIEEVYEKSLSGKATFAIDIGVTKNTPYLSLDTLYSIGNGSDKAAGVLKTISAESSGSLQICAHNEMGYREAFKEASISFINAFVEPEKESNFYRAIYKIVINGKPVGFGIENHSIDNDGDIQSVSNSSMLMPLSKDSLARSDSSNTSWSRPDGSLINASEYTIENDSLTSRYRLTAPNGEWIVEGELQGKEINSSLNHNSWILSEFGLYQQTARLLESDQPSDSFKMWVSDSDPTSTTDVTIAHRPNNSDSNITMVMGPISIDLMAEKDGSYKSGKFELGPMKMSLELIYSHGRPLLP